MRKILSIVILLTLVLSLVTANGLARSSCGSVCCCKPVATVYAPGTERIESILSTTCCGNEQMHACGSGALATYRRIECTLSSGHTEQTLINASAATHIKKIIDPPPSVGDKYYPRILKIHSPSSSLFDQNCLLLI